MPTLEAQPDSEYESVVVTERLYTVYRADAFAWLRERKANSIHAVVTDPPYGLLEYRRDQLEKMKLVSHLVYGPFIEAGFETRGEIIRIVHRLRGGDRPKNAHEEFADVTVLPKSCWEPWGLFRKPCEGRVQDNLRKWGTDVRIIGGKPIHTNGENGD